MSDELVSSLLHHDEELKAPVCSICGWYDIVTDKTLDYIPTMGWHFQTSHTIIYLNDDYGPEIPLHGAWVQRGRTLNQRLRVDA